MKLEIHDTVYILCSTEIFNWFQVLDQKKICS